MWAPPIERADQRPTRWTHPIRFLLFQVASLNNMLQSLLTTYWPVDGQPGPIIDHYDHSVLSRERPSELSGVDVREWAPPIKRADQRPTRWTHPIKFLLFQRASFSNVLQSLLTTYWPVTDCYWTGSSIGRTWRCTWRSTRASTRSCATSAARRSAPTSSAPATWATSTTRCATLPARCAAKPSKPSRTSRCDVLPDCQPFYSVL